MKILSLLVLTALVGCSNGEEEIEASRRRAAQERERIEEAQAQAQAQAQAPAAEEERAPPEPEYEEVRVYTFTYPGAVSSVRCEAIKKQNCGLSFSLCYDDNIYECLTNVRYTYTDEKREVKKEDQDE